MTTYAVPLTLYQPRLLDADRTLMIEGCEDEPLPTTMTGGFVMTAFPTFGEASEAGREYLARRHWSGREHAFTVIGYEVKGAREFETDAQNS